MSLHVSLHVSLVYIPLWLIRNSGVRYVVARAFRLYPSLVDSKLQQHIPGDISLEGLYPSLVDSKLVSGNDSYFNLVYIPLWLIRNFQLIPTKLDFLFKFISLFG